MRGGTYANALVDAMADAGVCTTELARTTGIARGTIYSYREGLREPGFRNFALICDALGVPFARFEGCER